MWLISEVSLSKLDLPLVSVGLPAFNSEKTIEKAITSILNQTYTNLEVIISDNNSNDLTTQICIKYEIEDPRVRLTSQEINFGPTKNFEFVLKKSNGKYFMWVAGDDYLSSDFIETNVAELETHQNYVASTSPNVFPGQNLESVKITSSLRGTRVQRFKSFFEHPGTSHALFYSLMRRDILIKCSFVKELFFAWDWAIVLHMANYGEINRAKAGEIFFSPGGFSQTKPYERLGLIGMKRLYPFLIFNKKILEICNDWAFLEKLTVYKLLFDRNKANLISYFKETLIKQKVNSRFSFRRN